MEKTPLLLKPSKIKSILLTIISTAFVCLGIVLLEEKMLIGILNIVFFGICLLIFILQLIPNSSYLKIDERGIEMKNLFKITFIPWNAVSTFRTKRVFINNMVVFDLDERLVETNNLKTKMGAFPDTYGMSAIQLAQLLNDYKNQFKTI